MENIENEETLVQMSQPKKNKKNPIKYRKTTKYDTPLCNNTMSFDECELAILRNAVDESDKLKGKEMVDTEDIKKIISILESFLIKHKLICYGGTAINNILPKSAQFYDRKIELPDYDFYSTTPLEHAKELADIYYKAGFEEVEAKAGVHYGTFKVFVNFIGIADITMIHPSIYEGLNSEAITIAGIRYAPANYLRMNMYLELSRPAGDVSRWEKIMKRLTLLNEHYPFQSRYNCDIIEIQRKMENDADKEKEERIYYIIRDLFIDFGAVFFGGYANSLYQKYMTKEQKRFSEKIPDFDVLYEEPDKLAQILTERLQENGFKNITIKTHDAISDIIPYHIEICMGKEILAFIYKPIACHNYNTITIGKQQVNIATIDTILSFYLAFYYSDEPYYYKDRILCMAEFLFQIIEKNRLNQRGILKRFSLQCYGKQPTLPTIREEKMRKYEELRGKRGTKDYEMWFLKYSPKSIYGNNDVIKNGVSVAKSSKKKNMNAKRKKRAMKTQRRTTRTGNILFPYGF